MVDIGKLNKRVTFLRPVGGKDEMLQDKLTYEEYKTLWATVKPYKSNDSSLNGKKSPEASHKIYVRYREDITSDMRMRYNKINLKMVGFPVDLEERHELLEIQAEVIM